MAKKRGRKKKSGEFLYAKEIIGSILIFLFILGIFNVGVPGSAIKACFVLLFGYLYIVGILLFIFFLLKLVFKNLSYESIRYRIVGFIVFFVGLLMFIDLLTCSTLNTSVKIWENFLNCFDGMKIVGGGIIGSFLSKSIIGVTNSFVGYFVTVVLMLVGFVVLFKLNVVKLFKLIFKKKNKDVPKSAKKKLSDIKQSNEVVKDEVHEFEPINNSNYVLPNVDDILVTNKNSNINENKSVIKSSVDKLELVLKDFDISAKVVGVNVGPAVTQYELELKAGTKVNRVLGINREISLALAAKDVRIQAPIPGRNTIGIELPNIKNSIVSLKEVYNEIPKNMANSKLCVPLGKNIMGKSIFMEINKTPHLLVAGATGSGKSCCINSIITTLLLRNTPDEVRLVLIDPKKVEMSVYNGSPHLLMPVVTDPRKASVALMKMVSEMERRYDLFDKTNTKNIVDYNNSSKSSQYEKIPYVVIIIDELADLMLVASKEVEDSIMRITQMARASGIHLIVATQRPSTDVITGLVKSNIPSRISFAVSSSIDSRTILDMTGAEKLLGKGDMLFLPMGENTPVRVQGAYVTDAEIKKIVDYTVSQQKVKYDESFVVLDEKPKIYNEPEKEDPLYNEVIEFVVKNQKASASLLQRRFKIGYNRAARMIDLLEERGIVGAQMGSKSREVLVDPDDEY